MQNAHRLMRAVVYRHAGLEVIGADFQKLNADIFYQGVFTLPLQYFGGDTVCFPDCHTFRLSGGGENTVFGQIAQLIPDGRCFMVNLDNFFQAGIVLMANDL